MQFLCGYPGLGGSEMKMQSIYRACLLAVERSLSRGCLVLCLSQQPLSPHHTLPCVLEDMFSIGISLGVFSSLVKKNNNNNFCFPTHYRLSPLTWFSSPLLIFEYKIRPTLYPFCRLDWHLCWHWEPWTQSVCTSLPLLSQGSLLCVWSWEEAAWAPAFVALVRCLPV